MATYWEAFELVVVGVLHDLSDEGSEHKPQFILTVDGDGVEATFKGAHKVVTATAPNPVEAIVKAGRQLGYNELYPKWEEE